MRERTAVRSIEELAEPETRREKVLPLNSASVQWADYGALIEDFPELRSMLRAPSSNAKVPLPSDVDQFKNIDAWLLKHAAIISEAQARPNEVNEPIPPTRERRIAYRPPRYGRALIVPIHGYSGTAGSETKNAPLRNGTAGLLDIKGCGVAPGQFPRCERDSNGLLTTAEAFKELATQRIIETLMAQLKVDVTGVPVYAILDLGFRCRIPGSRFIPAGAIVRRAHKRQPENNDLPYRGNVHHQVTLQIELLLRLFGITSSSSSTCLRIWADGDTPLYSYGGYPGNPEVTADHLTRLLASVRARAPVVFDCINVQLCRDARIKPLTATLFDFDQYEFRASFENNLLSLVRNRPINWGACFWRRDKEWIQPKRYAVNMQRVGPRKLPRDLKAWTGASDKTLEVSGPALLGLTLSRDIADGRATRSEIAARMNELVAAAVQPARSYFSNGHKHGAPTKRNAGPAVRKPSSTGSIDRQR
jgi:hypothetical protein